MNGDSQVFGLNRGSAQIQVQIAVLYSEIGCEIAAEIDQVKAGKTQGLRVEIAFGNVLFNPLGSLNGRRQPGARVHKYCTSISDASKF